MPTVMETIRPATPASAGGGNFRRAVYVVYTCHDRSVAALRTAGALAERWNARVAVLAPKPVPFPRDVADPVVPRSFYERQLEDSLRQTCVEATISILLCRDCTQALIAVVPPHSIVVIGTRRRWWRTVEDRLATSLRLAGHDVVLAPME